MTKEKAKVSNILMCFSVPLLWNAKMQIHLLRINLPPFFRLTDDGSASPESTLIIHRRRRRRRRRRWWLIHSRRSKEAKSIDHNLARLSTSSLENKKEKKKSKSPLRN